MQEDGSFATRRSEASSGAPGKTRWPGVNGLALDMMAALYFYGRQMSLPLRPIRANKIRDGLWSSEEYGESGWGVAFFLPAGCF